MIPAVDNSHATEAVGLLTSRYRATPNVSGFAKVIGLAAQEVENAFQSILSTVQLSNHPMAGGPWNILDQLGAIVGVTRDGRTDAAYVPLIKIKIRVNRSRGLAEDIIDIATLITSGVTYAEYYPAAFEVGVFGLTVTSDIVNALLLYLGEARSAGTSGQLRYSLDAAVDITWDTTVATGGPLSAAAGFNDSTSGDAPGNELVSLQNLLTSPGTGTI